MNTILKMEKETIENERKKLGVPHPIDFEEGRITPKDIEKLMPLALMPFSEEAVKTSHVNGFVSKGISYDLYLNRLQEVFGYTHVKLEHTLKEEITKPSKDTNKDSMIYCKVYVTIKIGNYTLYVDINNKPATTFVEYLSIDGVGYTGSRKSGTAEKNAISNGIKDGLRKLGMTRDLYIEENTTEDFSDEYNSDEDFYTEDNNAIKTNTALLRLTETPIINEKSTIFFKCAAIDTTLNKDVDLIIYKENKMNPDHNSLIDLVNRTRSSFRPNVTISIKYRENDYMGRTQYMVYGINKKSEGN